MISGYLCEKAGYWYMVLETKDTVGKRKPKWMATGLPVKGNKKQAEDMLYQKRVEHSALQRFQKNTAFAYRRKVLIFSYRCEHAYPHTN